MYYIGVDLGGTKICTGLMNEAGELLHVVECPTRATEGPKAVLQRIVDSVRSIRCAEPELPVSGIGIGAPGPLNPHTGTLHNPPNLPGWDGLPLREWVHEATGLPTVLDNDANAAAAAEHWFGAGKGTRNMVYVTVSTGIGAGVVVDGQVRQGTAGNFGEVGHIIVHPGGRRCKCGNAGCLEVLASGTAIAERAAAVYGQPLSAKDVAERAASGDAVAEAILRDAFRYLGIGMVNLVNLFDPEVMVIGGGVAQMGRPLFDSVRQALCDNHFNPRSAEIPVLPALLGTKAGVMGAAVLALHAFGSPRVG
ncbi:N-acylmannosamine kinase [Alicyclobacillus contaminans]|uniref:ROK family protein n=1 Tax=Alicyclobacillus contaminans TaxID=392016 RepID=UPI0004173FC0|nr:ROK family protein [Alicyclobacillus contaminans]GMA51636.1 N-acylmannosamine kinase [Alicyclobacillus contaminans]